VDFRVCSECDRVVVGRPHKLTRRHMYRTERFRVELVEMPDVELAAREVLPVVASGNAILRCRSSIEFKGEYFGATLPAAIRNVRSGAIHFGDFRRHMIPGTERWCP
jgi:hypothetical protein